MKLEKYKNELDRVTKMFFDTCSEHEEMTLLSKDRISISFQAGGFVLVLGGVYAIYTMSVKTVKHKDELMVNKFNVIKK